MLVSYRQLAATTARVVESHVFSWSRSRFFKIAGVGVRFSKMLESELGVGFKKVGSWSLESEMIF